MKKVNITNSGSILKTVNITWCLVMLYLAIGSAIIFTSSYIAFAESLEDFVLSSHGQAGVLAESTNSAEKFIPQYSEKLSHAAANEMASKDDNALRNDANKKIIEAKQGNGSGADQIIIEVSKKKPLDNIENHEIFKKAAKVYANPISELGNLTDKECKNNTNDQRNNYFKKKVKTKKKDIEYEEVTCEKPDETISCEKVLEVTCEETAECRDYGIKEGSLESNIYMEIKRPVIEIGTVHVIKALGKCQVLDKIIKFKVKNKALVEVFKISHIAYSDWVRIRVNGEQVLNTLGGDGDFKMVDNFYYKEGHEYCAIVSGSAKRRCNTHDWYENNPNLDLRKYLKEGDNEIQIELAFGNQGKLYIKIDAQQFCCNKFIDTWTKKCKSG